MQENGAVQGAQVSAIPPPAAGPSEAPLRAHRRAVAISLGMNAIGLVSLVALLAAGRTDWISLTVFAAMFCITAIGVEVGMHRMLSHRAFEAGRATRSVLVVA